MFLPTRCSCGRAQRYIWVDGNGIYHALAHAFSPFFGVHAFVKPEDVPKNWKTDVMRWTLGGVACKSRTPIQSKRRHSRRQLPVL